MTDTEMTIAIAELDGYTKDKQDDRRFYKNILNKIITFFYPPVFTEASLPSYLTSRDAIIPVIEKVCNELRDAFLNELRELVHKETGRCIQNGWLLIIATPRQLSIALLKATGKYK